MNKFFRYLGIGVASVIIFSCTAKKKTDLIPQNLNITADLKEVGASAKKISEIDSLLQSFVDKKKLNSVVGFVAKRGSVVYHKAFEREDFNRIVKFKIVII